MPTDLITFMNAFGPAGAVLFLGWGAIRWLAPILKTYIESQSRALAQLDDTQRAIAVMLERMDARLLVVEQRIGELSRPSCPFGTAPVPRRRSTKAKEPT